jgi:hypothetical protein
MKSNHLTASLPSVVITCALLAAVAARAQTTGSTGFVKQAQPQASFSAVVKQKEARFSLPVPPHNRWKWRRPEADNNAQEYRMDATVHNEGREYTFGFYLWKRAGAAAQSGDLSDLIKAGQASVFERSEPRRFTIIRDAGLKLKVDGNTLWIEIHGSDNVKRLFSSRPSDVTFKINVPGDAPISQTVQVSYQD